MLNLLILSVRVTNEQTKEVIFYTHSDLVANNFYHNFLAAVEMSAEK